MKLKLALVITTILSAGSAWSQWSGDGDLAYSNANGNTNTTALAAALALSKETGSTVLVLTRLAQAKTIP